MGGESTKCNVRHTRTGQLGKWPQEAITQNAVNIRINNLQQFCVVYVAIQHI